MPLAKRLLPVLLALLWAPLAVHCELEALTGWDLLHCETVADHPDSPAHCGDEACRGVESGLYQLPPDQLFVPPVFISVMTPVIEDLLLSPVREPEYIQEGPAPDLPRPWQFVFRAALPSRAPSVIS